MKTLILILSSVISLMSFHELAGQGVPSLGGGGENDGMDDKNFSFIPIPYINYDRSLGFQAGALPMAMYKVNKNDTISPASISGLFGMYTSNDSWFTMFFQQLYLKEDNWRITAAGGYGNINFQFFLDFPFSRYIDYNTKANFVFLMVQKKIVKNLYIGVDIIYADLETFVINTPNLEIDPTILRGFGGVISYDTRDDVYYPKDGFITNANLTTFPSYLDNEFVSTKLDFDYNKYWGVRQKKDVIAARAYIGAGLGSLSFQQQFIVGQTDLRGYTQGKYRGDQLYAVQGEYRWNLYKKLSLVGFGGVATITGALNSVDNGKILPAAGGGFRINVVEKYHMNVGLDAAAGINDWGIYFRIGEAF